MLYAVYGAFEIEKKDNGLGSFDNAFWQEIEKFQTGLSTACGCYVFSIKNRNNFMPWYVGKTEKRTFAKECFEATKINYYNEAIAGRKGKPVLILIARLTASQNKFSKPTSGTYKDVDFLESMLIGKALEKNPELLNVSKTQLLREMMVPGIINTPKGNPSGPVRQLKNALGMN